MAPRFREPPLRLGVLASGTGRTLANLLARAATPGELPARVAVVIGTKAGCRALDLARAAGVPAVELPRRAFAGDEAFSAAVTEALRAAQVGLVCCAGLMHRYLFPPEFHGRVMNVHPALLPAFGGRGYYGGRVHEAVLAAGVKVSGCTVHFCDHEYDHGPIIVQIPVPVQEDDTPETLAARVFEVEKAAYPRALRLFAEGKLHIEGGRVRVR